MKGSQEWILLSSGQCVLPLMQSVRKPSYHQQAAEWTWSRKTKSRSCNWSSQWRCIILVWVWELWVCGPVFLLPMGSAWKLGCTLPLFVFVLLFYYFCFISWFPSYHAPIYAPFTPVLIPMPSFFFINVFSLGYSHILTDMRILLSSELLETDCIKDN